MELKQRLFIGCLGALAPILVNLCIVDLQTVFIHLRPIEAISYAIREFALCASACLVVYLNGDEIRPVKLFQLGVMAPAMITSTLNGAAIVTKAPTNPTPSAPSASAPPSASSHTWLFFVTPANAQPSIASTQSPPVHDCTKSAAPTVQQQILKGLVGIAPGNQWFVVVSSNGTAAAATAAARLINEKFPSKYHPEICTPTTVPNSPYRVVIGEYMTYADATTLKNDAVAAGLPSDTWLWNPFTVSQ